MTARTAVVAGLVDLVRNAFTNIGAGQTPDAANGNTIPDPGRTPWSCRPRTAPRRRSR